VYVLRLQKERLCNMLLCVVIWMAAAGSCRVHKRHVI